ncbi:MAG: YkgJ family cysteine cluster protein [Thiohalomonadaceae bacterium]|jgi:Fe-S-cluster containining protein
MADTPFTESPFPSSPVLPKLFDGDKTISFSCHKGISCWNACCANIDITLTPYDVIRLKKRLGLDSGDFLRQYTVPFELEKDGIAGVKFKPVEDGSACQFMRPEGCAVYEDRPTACRYYPVALVAMRKQDEYTDTSSYALVKEPHCKGHEVDRPLTIDEYRQEQGVAEYDEQSRGWRQLILKKMSSGPTIGKPSLRSRQLYFMACYDMDRFREFVRSEGFQSSFELADDLYKQLLEDDSELMQFGFRFLKQVMFGEVTIPTREDAVRMREQRLMEQQEMLIQRRPYDPADEVLEWI